MHNKINKIRIEILELDKRLSKKDKKEYVRELFDILDDKLRKTSITRAEKRRILDWLTEISNELRYKRKYVDLIFDDSNCFGLKDIEYTFGDLDDYCKPILAIDRNNGSYKLHTCRGDKDRDMSIDTYLGKVTLYLRILIDEKKTSDHKIQFDIGINLKHITVGNRITF